MIHDDDGGGGDGDVGIGEGATGDDGFQWYECLCVFVSVC